MIRDSKLREDAPQTSNEKNKSVKKREVFLFLRVLLFIKKRGYLKWLLQFHVLEKEIQI